MGDTGEDGAQDVYMSATSLDGAERRRPGSPQDCIEPPEDADEIITSSKSDFTCMSPRFRPLFEKMGRVDTLAEDSIWLGYARKAEVDGFLTKHGFRGLTERRSLFRLRTTYPLHLAVKRKDAQM